MGGAFEEVSRRVWLQAALRTNISVREAHAVAVIEEPRAVARPQLGQSTSAVAREPHLILADLWCRATQEFVGDLEASEIVYCGAVDLIYYLVVGVRGGYSTHEVVFDIPQESRLQGGDSPVSAWAGWCGYVAMRRVVGAEGANQELGAQHSEVGFNGEDLSFGKKVVGIGHVMRSGDGAKTFVLDDL